MARGNNTPWLLLGIAGALALLVAALRRTASSSSSGGAVLPFIGPGSGSFAPAAGPFAPVDPFAASGGSVMTDLNQFTAHNSSLAQRRAAFAPFFQDAETQHGIAPGLLLQQGIAESQLDPSALSSAGAIGIMQMLPRFFPGAGRDALADINTAATEMARLFAVFGTWTLALAAYNAGQGNVEKYGGVPPFAETQAYVKKILGPLGINEPDVLWA